MNGYLTVGITVGVIMWLGKYILASVVLPKRVNKWLHHNPVGLLILDILFGTAAVKTISLCGASGLVTLIVLVSYGACTTLLILKFMIVRKTTKIYHSIKGVVPHV